MYVLSSQIRLRPQLLQQADPQPSPHTQLGLPRQSSHASPRGTVNSFRQARVADVLDDFRTLQYYISAAPADPPSMEDYYTDGWATLRQCAAEGQNILACAADTSVPSSKGGPGEQEKAELQQ